MADNAVLSLDPSDVELDQPQQKRAAAPPATPSQAQTQPAVELSADDVEMETNAAPPPSVPNVQNVQSPAPPASLAARTVTMKQARPGFSGVMPPPPDPLEGTIKQGAPPTVAQRAISTVSNSAPGTALRSALPKLAEAVGMGTPTESFAPNDPEAQQRKQQLVSPELLVPRPEDLPNTVAAKAEAGARGVLKAAGGMTTPENLAMLFGGGIAPEAISAIPWLGRMVSTPQGLKAIQGLISAGFTIDMARGLYEQGGQFRKQIDAQDWNGAMQTLGEMSVTGTFAAMSGKHAVKELAHTVSYNRAPAPDVDIEAEPQPEAQVPPAGGSLGETPASVAPVDLSPNDVEVADAVRPGDAQVQARPVPVVERGAGQGPQAGDSDNAVGETPGGAGQGGVQAPEAGRPLPRVKSATATKVADARKVDRLRKGEILAVDTQHEGPKTLRSWMKGMDFVPNPEGGRVIFDPKKTTREKVEGAISRGELYKLTGDAPPPERVAEVRKDLAPDTDAQVSPGSAAADQGRTSTPVAGGRVLSGDQAGDSREAPEGTSDTDATRIHGDSGGTRADARGTSGGGESTAGDVILARHGETKLDQEGAKDTVAGWTAEPLDERGKKSAAEMAVDLREHQPTKIVTSDLERATQTAEIAGEKLGVPVTEDARLRPQRTPETEGKQMGEAKPIHDYYVDHPDERPPGGETFNEAKERQGAAIEEAKAEGGKPVILTHSRNIEAEVGETPEPGGIVAGEVLGKDEEIPKGPLEKIKDELRGQYPNNSEEKIDSAAREQLRFEDAQKRGNATLSNYEADKKHGPLVIKTIQGRTESLAPKSTIAPVESPQGAGVQESTQPKTAPEGAQPLIKGRELAPPEPEEKGTPDVEAHKALYRSLHTFSGAGERWDKLVKKGATDEQIKKQIGYELGIQGGGLNFSHKGGDNPRFYYSEGISGGAYGKPTLQGKALVNKVRDLLQIPRPEEAKPAVQLEKESSPEGGEGRTINLSAEDVEHEEAREPRGTEEVPSVPPLVGEGGSARVRDEAPRSGGPGEAGEDQAGDRQPDRELLERPGGREGGRVKPARSGGDSPTEHSARVRERRARQSVGRDGADGKPVESPAPEAAEPAVKTARELRNQRNFRITDEARDTIGSGGEITKIKGNLDALELLKKIQSEGRELPTDDERATLAKYVDFGGLTSMLQRHWEEQYRRHYERFNKILTPEEIQEVKETTINTHHTSLDVVDQMWKAMQRLGFKGGRILEPGMGIGNFLGRIPKAISDRSELYGVEKNPLTGAMAKMLYPDANIQVKDFQKWQLPNNSLDAVIGNVPFSEVKVTDDPLYKDPKLSLHNYFITKALDKLKPGGVAALITSRYTMDGEKVSARAAREGMAQRADLVAAIRLPDSAFKKHAGTEVVTDLLVFQKRDPAVPLEGTPSWVDTEHVGVGDKTYALNKYWQEHPEHIVGEHSQSGSMYGPGQYTVKGPQDFNGALKDALATLPEKIYGKLKTPALDPAPSTMEPLDLAPDAVKPGAFYKDDKGRVLIKQSGVGVELPEDLKKYATKIKGAVDLRDKLNEVIQAQLSSSDDETMKAGQKELGKLYDAFTKKYGDLHGRDLKKAFGTDPEYPKLLALENVDPDTKKISKAKIFDTRVLSPYEPLRDLPEDPRAAMLKVMADRGYLDTDKMASLLGKDKGEVVADLEKQGLIYQDPAAGTYHTADEYLSGNVRDKLKQAEAAAAVDPRFERNVEELKKVQPKPLTIHEVLPNLGQTWIPKDIYESFVKHLSGGGYQRRGAGVEITRDATGRWKVDLDSGFNRFDLDHKWGAGDVAGHKLVEYALNQQTPTIYDHHSDGTRSINQEKTIAAREKLAMIKEEFRTVLRKAPEATVRRLEDLYNDGFNGHRLREYSGEHLDFPGMAKEWQEKVRGYQKAAVWRIMQEGRALLAHAVGLGKTLTMISSGMEAKRLKMSRKNMYAVPNHMVNQWREDFKRFYPNANVLSVTDEDFNATNRAQLMSRIATGDWDAVIIPHSQFDLLPMSPEYERKTIDKRLGDYRQVLEDLDPQENRRTIKQIEKSVDKLEARLQELNQKKKDNTIPFDQLGVDMMFVDEAHAYKAMAVPSKMGQVAGISNRASQRALAMEMKTDYMRETHNGRGTVFATGTPITNTMGELYAMTKYLAPDMLESQGIRSFDDWAANFANTVTNWEYSPDGVTFRPKTALAEFVNVPELSTGVRRFGDFLSKANAKLKEPTPARKDTMVRITPNQEPLLESIADRGEKLRGPMASRPDPSEDNWLKLSGDARKMSLDPRLYDSSLPDEEGSKANAAVKNLKADLDASKDVKGTALVFSDFFEHKTPDGKADFNLFKDIKDKLVKQGVSKDEIAIIHDFKTKDAKEALFANVRSGKVRVLMGSTDKMGIGTNVQDRLKSMHHLDQPWRPDQVEQREGRIIRSGNMHDDVNIYRYISEPSPGKIMRLGDNGQMVETDRPRAYDLQMYQQLARKANFIEQFLSGNVNGRTMEDAAGDVKLNSQMFEMAKAMATGNPDAMKKIKLEHDMRTYQMLDRNWQVEHSRNARQMDQYQLIIPAIQHRMKQVSEALDLWKKADDGKNVSLGIGDRTITDKDELKKYMEANPDLQKFAGQTLKLYGIETPIEERISGDKVAIQYRQAGEWHDVPGETPTLHSLMASFAARARGLDNRLETHDVDLKGYTEKLSKLKGMVDETSPYRAKLDPMEKELKEINTRLGIGKKEGVAEDEVGDATATPDDGAPDEDPTPSKVYNSGEAGFARMGAMPAVLPFTMAYEGVKRISRIFNDASTAMGEKLTEVGLGKTRPEIRRSDPDLADEMTRLDASWGYHTEKAKQIIGDVIGGLTRPEEKGFVLVADQSTRDWLRDNRPQEYTDYITNPKIIRALSAYKPYEQVMRDAARELGTKVIDDDYLHRVYDTEGVGKATAKKGRQQGSNFDELVSPQIDRMRGRTMGADYYYEKGLHEFGPSFATRYVSLMTKLQEHKTAMEFMSKASKLGPFSAKQKEAMRAAGQDPDQLPDSIDYNGKTFYSTEMAKLIRDSKEDTAESKALAAQLGVPVLPKPKEVREYGIYEPLKGKRLENSAAALAAAVLKDSDDRQLAGRAAQVMRSLSTRYAGPKEITEALTHSRPDLVPQATMWLSRKIAPATNLLRQQIIGLGFMVHFANDMRRIAQTPIGGVANPVGFARAIKVALSSDLKERGKMGTGDATVDMLLKNAAWSPHGAEEYKHYVSLNTEVSNWFGLQNAFKEGGQPKGRLSLGSVAGAPFKLAAEALRPISKTGHDVLFGPGGMDQRSRIWLADFARAHDPTLSDADIAHLVNERLGRYNRASWTKLQREIAPFMLFPGWDFSSMAYILQHPIRTALPPAVVVWAANRMLHAGGYNKNDDKNDPFYIHVGDWNLSTNLLREPLAARVGGATLRAGKELVSGHGPGQAAAEAARGVPADVAGVSTNLLNPMLQAVPELAMNRERGGSSGEIIKRGATKRRALGFRGGEAVKELGQYAAKKAAPLYGRYTAAENGDITPASLLSNVGVTAFKRKRLH